MSSDFFKSPSPAENAFRAAVCSLALAACLLCAFSESRRVILSPETAEKLSGTAFMTFGTSEPDAYLYRDFFTEYIAEAGGSAGDPRR